ncbi:MAG: hypothetical protein HY936_04650 [Nitrosomonadales bacterium]|nr:hypothetical protein [Nitrosomonadales bacterium]
MPLIYFQGKKQFDSNGDKTRDEDGKVYIPWKDVVLNVSLTGDTLAA